MRMRFVNTQPKKYSMKKLFVLITLMSFAVIVNGQKKPLATTYTPGKERLQSFQQRKKLEENSLVGNVKFRSAGPTIMSGRVVDMDISPNDPNTFYTAYASGGLWKTINNGTTFESLFDKQEVMTIGDIAVDWNHGETIWIGTGENNSSRSSYAGVGVYKSSDKGKTWQHMGLEETQHIGRVIIDPSDPNTVWVAALGHLYSHNKERGIFKTTDGGKSWKHTLFIDDVTGAIDLVIDPSNPKVLYTSMWQRERCAWNFTECGKGSGIYKSTDGGETWKLITNETSGFPTGEGIGRIGLGVASSNSNIVYAVLDNQAHRKEDAKEKNKEALTKNQFKTMSKEEFLALNEEKLKIFLETNNFPESDNSASIKKMVKEDKIKPSALAEYLEDANAMLFDTPVTGTEVYRSDDGGSSWKKTHSGFLDDIFYTYGYYFGVIKVSPSDPNKIYIAGVPVLTSADGGKTFKLISADNMHSDHHVLWIDPKMSGHIINGNDGGVNVTYDEGKNWVKLISPPVGQFYTVNVDMEMPYNVYGGLQDNGVWYGSSTYREGTGWQGEGEYPYKRIMGGDGMQVVIDTRDNNTVYTGYQFGYYFRINKKTGETKPLNIRHKLGERPLRFNWQSPIWLSKHNQDIIYFGSNKFHRSMNKGDDFQTLSGDLTKGGKKGDVAYGTLTSIHESPLRFGLIYVGSDDGLIHVSKDGGSTWKKISVNMPGAKQESWVSRVTASSHDTGTVYVSLNDYRNDNFTPYLFRSDNYGTTWQRIGNDLPMESINVVRDDPENANIIYVGTDNGVYVSLNKGNSFMRMSNGIPAVAVHDLVVHPRDKELVVGTHGRSIYIANVKHLQQLSDSLMAKDLFAFDINSPKYNKNWGKRWSQWEEPDTQKLEISYYLKTGGNVSIKILTEKGLLLKELKDNGEKGINLVNFDLSIDESALNSYVAYLNENRKKDESEITLKPADDKKIYLRPGKYVVEIEAAGKKEKKEFSIKEKAKSAGTSEPIPGQVD
jgi:photosystem II stability/assembly factor-like uncharacterized protein